MGLLIIGVVTLIILLFVVSFVRHGRIGPAVIVIFTIMVTLAALFWSPSRTNYDSIELIPPGLQADDRDSRPIQRHLYGTTAPSSIPDSGLSSQPSAQKTASSMTLLSRKVRKHLTPPAITRPHPLHQLLSQRTKVPQRNTTSALRVT